MMKMLKVNEIFFSIQGESSKAGCPCVFIRLANCNLRCSYCDTAYAYTEGNEKNITEILAAVRIFNCNLVEVTGGEPLLQPATSELLEALCSEGYEVMLETNGSLPVKNVDKRVKIILDIKCPSSNMSEKNYYDNLYILKSIDEIKFVIGTREDYQWAKDLIFRKELKNNTILFSPVFGSLEPVQLVNWVLEDNLNVRVQLQLHKYIWDPAIKGV